MMVLRCFLSFKSSLKTYGKRLWTCLLKASFYQFFTKHLFGAAFCALLCIQGLYDFSQSFHDKNRLSKNIQAFQVLDYLSLLPKAQALPPPLSSDFSGTAQCKPDDILDPVESDEDSKAFEGTFSVTDTPSSCGTKCYDVNVVSKPHSDVRSEAQGDYFFTNEEANDKNLYYNDTVRFMGLEVRPKQVEKSTDGRYATGFVEVTVKIKGEEKGGYPGREYTHLFRVPVTGREDNGNLKILKCDYAGFESVLNCADTEPIGQLKNKPDNTGCMCDNDDECFTGSVCENPCSGVLGASINEVNEGEDIGLSNQCTCGSGFYNPDTNSCETSQCPVANSSLVGGACVCSSGYQENNDGTACEACGPNEEVYNGVCVPVCPSGATRNSLGTCECPNGQYCGSDECIACPFGKASDGTCRECPDAVGINSSSPCCSAEKYLHKDEDDNYSCKDRCPENSDWKNVSEPTDDPVYKCVCDKNYKYYYNPDNPADEKNDTCVHTDCYGQWWCVLPDP